MPSRRGRERLRRSLWWASNAEAVARNGEVDRAPPRRAGTASGRMGVRRHKLILLVAVQLGFSALLWLAALDVTRFLYPRENALSLRLLLPLAVFFSSYFLLAWRRLYSRDYHYYFRRVHSALLKTSVLPAVLALLAFVLLGAGTTHPVVPALLFLAAVFVSFPLADGCQHLWIRYLCWLGYFRKKILVVGRTGAGNDGDFGDLGFPKTYAGEIARSNGDLVWKPSDGGPPAILREFAQVRTLILKQNVGDVLLFSDGADGRAFERNLVEFCQSLAISYYRVPVDGATREKTLTDLLFPEIPVSERFAGPRDSLTAVSIKRLIDIVVALVCAALFLPVGLLIALAILVDDGGPVFYVSTRIGKNGRPMRFLKFRTMVRDAEDAKARLLAYNVRADGPLFKMKNDPRVTRVGQILRPYALDEFPQLLNVLRGSLSLVGPRPHLPREVEAYRGADYLRLECMPGIVGLPQVSGRGATMGFREWVDLDLRYRESWSLALDAGIMVKTLTQFVRGLFERLPAEHY